MKTLPLLLTAALLASCAPYPYHGAGDVYHGGHNPNTKFGAVTGGLAGAGLGGIIGHQSGSGLEGAAIGAGIGILAGALLGNAQDQYNRENTYRRDPNAPPPEGDYDEEPYGELPPRSYGHSSVNIGVGYGGGHHGGTYGSVGFGRHFPFGHGYGGYGHRRPYCW